MRSLSLFHEIEPVKHSKNVPVVEPANPIKNLVIKYKNLKEIEINERKTGLVNCSLRITALLECVIGIYKHEFTNKKQEI